MGSTWQRVKPIRFGSGEPHRIPPDAISLTTRGRKKLSFSREMGEKLCLDEVSAVEVYVKPAAKCVALCLLRNVEASSQDGLFRLRRNADRGFQMACGSVLKQLGFLPDPGYYAIRLERPDFLVVDFKVKVGEHWRYR